MLDIEFIKASKYNKKSGGEGAILHCFITDNKNLNSYYQIFTSVEIAQSLISKLKDTNNTNISDYCILKYDKINNRLYYIIDNSIL